MVRWSGGFYLLLGSRLAFPPTRRSMIQANHIFLVYPRMRQALRKSIIGFAASA
jgi:hypothetical protein